MTRNPRPVACVLGDMNLVRPLGRAGIPCAVVAPAGAATGFSRFTRHVVQWDGDWADGEQLADRLVSFARAQPEPPVLFYQYDEHVRFVSRHRQQLREAFRFMIAEPSQLDELVDKVRFDALAQRLGLPVPATVVLDTAAPAPPVDLLFPLILKPPTRGEGPWTSLAGDGKAIRVDDQRALRALWSRLRVLTGEIVAQEVVPGAESRIESYHVYIDWAGETVGEFTGQKIRTIPREYGFTTALVITDVADVAEIGRQVVRKLGLRGVAKVDFKRGPDGTLRLLEINPRFNLWHYPGAVAGINLPALVWADLADRGRPPVGPVRPGVRWCTVHDLHAARESGTPWHRWCAWAWGCEAKQNVAWDDPAMVVGRALWLLRHRRQG